jgi:REP element-mobilizing transposase RayT
MSNHTHLVIHIDKAKALAWSMDEVLMRWHQLFKGTVLTQRYVNTETRNLLTDAELYTIKQTADVYRCRLFDISWFMRILNEGIARQANEEDNCTGRFWEGRFKSQALLDEAALAACMAYVDLNPIRAKMAKKPESSDYTSIKLRSSALMKHQAQPLGLMPLLADTELKQNNALPFYLSDYVALVDITGKYHRKGHRGYASSLASPILDRLHITEKIWLTITERISNKSRLALKLIA